MNALELIEHLAIYGSYEKQSDNIKIIMDYLKCSKRTAYDYLNFIWYIEKYQIRKAQGKVWAAGNKHKPYGIDID